MTKPSDPSTSEISNRKPPKRTSRGREAISEETLTKIRSEAERTATGAMRLLRGARDRPAGLTVQMIDSWLHGAVKSAVPAHISYALNRWAALPTNRFMPLTQDVSAAMEAELNRTGMGAAAILKRADDLPSGLTEQVVLSWINRSTQTVSETHWEYVMTRLRALPDRSGPSPSSRMARMAREEIAASDLAELRRHRERTGIGGAVLLRTAADKPSGLAPAMISNWLNGVAKTAHPEHVAYVLARYRAWP